MTWRPIGIIVLLIAAVFGARYFYRYMNSEPLTVSFEEKDWQLHGYEDITLKSPFQLISGDENVISKLVPGVGKSIQYSYSSRAMSVYLTKLEFSPLFPVNLDSAAVKALQTIEKLEGAPILSYIVEPIKKNGIAGRRILALSRRDGDNVEVIAELFGDRFKLIQMVIIAPIHETNKLVTTRMLSSLDFYF